MELTQQSVTVADPELRHSLSALAQTTGSSDWDPTAICTSDPMLGAFRLVTGNSKIVVPPPTWSTSDETPLRAGARRLEEVARGARHRVRRVKLTGNWWRRDFGPLVAMCDDGRPVALLRARGGRYAIVDPSTGQRRPATSSIAKGITHEAFSVSAPLGDHSLMMREVIVLGLAACKRDWFTLIWVAVASGLLAIVTPLALRLIVETLIPENYRGQLQAVAMGLIACALATAALHAVGALAAMGAETRMANAVLPAVWDRLLGLPATFFKSYSPGDLAMRMMGLHQLQQMTVGTIGSVAFMALPAVCNLGLMYWLAWRIALWVTAILAVVILVAILLSWMEWRRRRAILAMEGELSNQVLETLSGIHKIKAAGAESGFYSRWAKAFGSLKRAAFKAQRVSTCFAVFASAVPSLVRLALFTLFVHRVSQEMSLGDFISFNAAAGVVVGSVISMSAMGIGLMGIVCASDRMVPVLQAVPESVHNLPMTGTLRGDIELRHLSFRYEPHAPLALDDVSLKIHAGEYVAIVGPSGSGKSTLLRILLGLAHPQSGSVHFDRRDLRALEVSSLRSQIGTVMQNGKILAGSIFEIIAGAAAISIDQAWTRLDQVGLGPAVRAMPMGVHTFINDGATTLSGGQRQQLLLARALVAKPRILLLDEATSALDNLSQAMATRTVEQMQATRIVIAHRMSSIMNADRIIVIEKGRIVQIGTFEQLSVEAGLFADLMTPQA